MTNYEKRKLRKIVADYVRQQRRNRDYWKKIAQEECNSNAEMMYKEYKDILYGLRVDLLKKLKFYLDYSNYQ